MPWVDVNFPQFRVVGRDRLWYKARAAVATSGKKLHTHTVTFRRVPHQKRGCGMGYAEA